MFTDEELKLIDEIHYGDFREIKNWNSDGSLNIDVFDLYKSDFVLNGFVVIEREHTRYKGTLTECLNYIHHWL